MKKNVVVATNDVSTMPGTVLSPLANIPLINPQNNLILLMRTPTMTWER